VLGRASDGDRTLSEWRRSALHRTRRVRDAATREVTIHLLDAALARPAASWRLHRAWPVRWTGPALDATEPTIAWEELELVYADLTWM
jgi:phage tail-like protein